MAEKRKKNNHALIAKERGLAVTEHMLAQFKPDARDLQIVEAMLHGHTKSKDIADFCEMSQSAIKTRLLDTTRSAWIAQQIDLYAGSRLGMVNGSLFARAVAQGDPSAARLLFELYGKLHGKGDGVKKSFNVNLNVDYSSFSSEQLQAMAAQEARKLGLTLEDAKSVREIIEAEAKVKPGKGKAK